MGSWLVGREIGLATLGKGTATSYKANHVLTNPPGNCTVDVIPDKWKIRLTLIPTQRHRALLAHPWKQPRPPSVCEQWSLHTADTNEQWERAQNSACGLEKVLRSGSQSENVTRCRIWSAQHLELTKLQKWKREVVVWVGSWSTRDPCSDNPSPLLTVSGHKNPCTG